MHLYSFVNYFTTNSESPLISTFFFPTPSRIYNPIINASYSASILEQEPLVLYLNFVGIFNGEIMKYQLQYHFYG